MAKELLLDQIMEFAHKQLGSDSPSVSVSDGEFDIVDPWYSSSPSGTYLSDEEAREEWGDELVDEFIRKATAHLDAIKD